MDIRIFPSLSKIRKLVLYFNIIIQESKRRFQPNNGAKTTKATLENQGFKYCSLKFRYRNSEMFKNFSAKSIMIFTKKTFFSLSLRSSFKISGSNNWPKNYKFIFPECSTSFLPNRQSWFQKSLFSDLSTYSLESRIQKLV